ncbi:transcriptional activator domain-containing protein [Gemmatirosa kalamazoonensis]|uniref:Transcriptional activator domain-containing protein n=1 Tax=Gemmatirosa kalamazoonensis TaxID=861299 RepID=W0RF60_9BACT|nr:BTAD domain-containing putative transcriptional regulator [Gemmatirosa kalamazoonensis]AHG89082.1 transcriptional activator domain-containing protein [Gemmatirosa kalamazoonensis]
MLRLRTFGGLALLDDGHPVSGPMTQRRRLALLAVLAAAGDRAVSRDKLVGWLWPESEEAKARHALSQWLFLLRKDLPPNALPGTDELRLDPAILPSDVATFRQALARGDLEAAVAVYDGPFLDGFHLTGAGEFERWSDEQRRELASHWRVAAEQVARTRLAAGDAAGAVAVWRRLAADDPTNARVARGLMEALDRAGDRSGALAHARVHAAVLREQLDLPADADVEALAERLRRSAARPAPAASASPTPVPERAPEPAPEPAPPEPIAPPVSAPPHRRRRLVRLAWVATAAATILLVGGATWAAVLVPEPQRVTAMTLLTRAPVTLDPRRVVVAPLDDQTRDPRLADFGELAAEWTTAALSGIGEYEVVDARSALVTARVVDKFPRLLRTGDRAVALAREIGAGMVVRGGYYRDHDSLRVYVQLTDAATGRVVRSLGVSSGSASEPEALVVPVSRRAAALFASAVDTSAVAIGIRLAPPPSYDAYRETLAAWGRYYQSDLRQALVHATRAARLDSTYVLPRVMAAYFHTELRGWATADSLLRAAESVPTPPSRLERASLEMVRADVRGDLEAELRAAQELSSASPGSAEMVVHVAHIAVFANRPRLALATLDRLDPTRGVLLSIPFYWNWKTAALHELGDHRRELDAAHRGHHQHPFRNAAAFNVVRAVAASGAPDAAREIHSLALHARTERWDGAAVRRRMLVEGSRELRAHGRPGDGAPLLDSALAEFDAIARRAGRDTSLALLEARAVLLAEGGRLTEARAAAERLLARDPRRVTGLGVLGTVAARGGDLAAARRADSLLAALPTPYLLGRHTLWRARIAALSGDGGRAVALLEQALDEGYPMVQGIAVMPGDASEFDYAETLVHADPAFDALRADPAFQRLLAPKG